MEILLNTVSVLILGAVLTVLIGALLIQRAPTDRQRPDLEPPERQPARRPITPSLTDALGKSAAYWRGYNDGHTGIVRNPYQATDPHHEQYRNGFADGRNDTRPVKRPDFLRKQAS